MKIFNLKSDGDNILTKIINEMVKNPEHFRNSGGSYFYSGSKLDYHFITVKNDKLILRKRGSKIRDFNEHYILSDKMIKKYMEYDKII